MFAWSNHEQEVLAKQLAGSEDGHWFAHRVENAIPLARRWKARQFPDVIVEKARYGMLGRHQLHRYFELIEYPVEKAFGPGNSAQRILYVRQMLETRGGDYLGLTPTAKAKWTKALQHNWHDCNGLREFVLRCATDLSKDVTPGSELRSGRTALPGRGPGSA